MPVLERQGSSSVRSAPYPNPRKSPGARTGSRSISVSSKGREQTNTHTSIADTSVWLCHNGHMLLHYTCQHKCMYFCMHFCKFCDDEICLTVSLKYAHRGVGDTLAEDLAVKIMYWPIEKWGLIFFLFASQSPDM